MIALYIMLPVCLPETESGAVGQSEMGVLGTLIWKVFLGLVQNLRGKER